MIFTPVILCTGGLACACQRGGEQKRPAEDKVNNWLPAPDGKLSLYIRAYWGEQSILDGTWQPPKIETVK